MLFAEREFELSKKNIPKDKLIETLKMEWSLYTGSLDLIYPIEYYTDSFILEHLIKTVIMYCKQNDSIKTIQRCLIELGEYTKDKDVNYIIETLMTCLANTEVKYFQEQINKLGD